MAPHIPLVPLDSLLNDEDYEPDYCPCSDAPIAVEGTTSPPESRAPSIHSLFHPVDPRDIKDPEGFLKRCSGYSKTTRARCHVGVKRRRSTTPIKYLPTCAVHRDQQTFAGFCKYKTSNGDPCAKLFGWSPPHLELCPEHEDSPDTPCYLLKLPLELRHLIFRYLLPAKPIGSSIAPVHSSYPEAPPLSSRHYAGLPVSMLPQPMPTYNTFPMPLQDLFLINRQLYHEARDFMYSIVPFIISIRKDGTFMCGIRLLEPTRGDGSSHFLRDAADDSKIRFLKSFNLTAVKNYQVDILVENWMFPSPHVPRNPLWDEEVEIYDIRDYVSVVTSGILARSTNLCKLNVRVCLADFNWSEDEILSNLKLIIGPFEGLRNVRKPQLAGVFDGRPQHNSMLTVERHVKNSKPNRFSARPSSLCSVPKLPNRSPILVPGYPAFDAIASPWARSISTTHPTNLISKPPIRPMFAEFKDFYANLCRVYNGIPNHTGRLAFLHRARVAREQENVEGFRELRNELIQYWYAYLDSQERQKNDMNKLLSKMLDADVYPASEWEEISPESFARRKPSTLGTSQSPILLDDDTMEKEGIPMTANPQNESGLHIPSLHQMQMQIHQHQQQVLARQMGPQYQTRPRRYMPATMPATMPTTSTNQMPSNPQQSHSQASRSPIDEQLRQAQMQQRAQRRAQILAQMQTVQAQRQAGQAAQMQAAQRQAAQTRSNQQQQDTNSISHMPQPQSNAPPLPDLQTQMQDTTQAQDQFHHMRQAQAYLQQLRQQQLQIQTGQQMQPPTQMQTAPFSRNLSLSSSSASSSTSPRDQSPSASSPSTLSNTSAPNGQDNRTSHHVSASMTVTIKRDRELDNMDLYADPRDEDDSYRRGKISCSPSVVITQTGKKRKVSDEADADGGEDCVQEGSASSSAAAQEKGKEKARAEDQEREVIFLA
ncbi:hypothetical protein IQ07DRAFT_594576 [Pyrenochaeta sp. DS3sAY3a]|nr:hypothetical protein IQ07DRAFT_594576 [Pyrenochaeta sp. DS3sAY3a]